MLWHPLECPANDVLSWRQRLERDEIVQPFKQAHREVYLLTDAERGTHTYSNRFAAHVLRQHQFSALCQQRGWKYQLQGGFDSWNAPSLDLPEHDLRIEFYVESADDPADLTDSYIYMHVSTDQVRFCRPDSHGAIPLEEIPQRVFSEVMRDVDLFVGVTSVGNDPAWFDGGAQGAHRDYWHEYAFGDLSQSAETRREVLARVVPKLKIADRCRLEGKFLLVDGDIRTYKIHLGSGNILMSPNDEYLCIVPAPGSRGTRANEIYLPFDGDTMLSIILSKAFMLADDRKIKDESIVHQINRG